MGGNDECPAVYVSDDPAAMIVQGKVLDAATLGVLLDLADDESAVKVPAETVLRAVGIFLADQGRADLRAAIEACVIDPATAEVLR